MNNRKLVLENGVVFEGMAFGATEEKIAELVFNTSVVGYQEILSDPSFCNKMVCMTYPLIGNYGMTDEDYESRGVYTAALIVREYNDLPSNFRFTRTLSEVMEENNVTGISGIDTRYLTRLLKKNGSMRALICDIEKPLAECMQALKDYQEPANLVSKVSCKKVWHSRTHNPKYTVVTIDCGTRLNLIKKLNEASCNVVVVPYNTKVEDIMKYKMDGLFISNGPGNPNDVSNVVDIINTFKGKVPMLGVSLGAQLIALSYGAKANKMKQAHRGSNYPVRNLRTNKISLTVQNHSFGLYDLDKTPLEITHVNVLDNEVEGVLDSKNSVMGVLFNPETGAGISEDEYTIKEFIELMKNFGGEDNA